MPLAMSPAVLAAMVLAAAVAGQVYRVLWRRLHDPARVPKGFGALLPLFLLAGAWAVGVPDRLLLVFVIIALGTPFYWWDDVEHVSRRVRLFLQFAAGVGVALALLIPALPGHTALVALDLNSATMNLLVFGLVLVFGPALFAIPAVIVLAFVIPFAIWNAKPERLYFGDAGCFVIACLVTAMIAQGVATLDYPALVILAPVVWACFDAVWVFAIRVRGKEDLLSRNYHHLYQKMQIKYGGRIYLIPQLVNVAAVLAAVKLLFLIGTDAPFAYGLPALLLPPAIYLACRRMFVDG
jgi:UDP-N-acetylmuramyl pentapeptide phosphotransferase/UDP-N-acetylglucosamine-1-phosphate transferase